MSNWIATNELRFVVRSEVSSDAVTGEAVEWIERILQQKWQSDEKRPFYDCFMTEWRDVPVVEEE